MGDTLTSRSGALANCQTYGAVRRFAISNLTSTTAATATCGSVNMKRFLDAVILTPELGAGVSAIYWLSLYATTPISIGLVVSGYEQTLGSLTVSGNVFSAGASMPTKTIEGVSVQTASMVPVVQVTTLLAASNPVLTITYVNQDGIGSRTATMTLPSNAAVYSTFLISPHLQSGDTGIRSVQNISISTGTAGALSVFGFIPQAIATGSTGGASFTLPFLQQPFPIIPFVEGDRLVMYVFGSTAVSTNHLFAIGTPDN